MRGTGLSGTSRQQLAHENQEALSLHGFTANRSVAGMRSMNVGMRFITGRVHGRLRLVIVVLHEE
jgi:hypothetical protein